MGTITKPVEFGVDLHLHKVQDEETRVNDLARLLDADCTSTKSISLSALGMQRHLVS